MKPFITSLLIASILSLSVPQLEAPPAPRPEPQVFTCIVTVIALGLFAACAVACYWHGMTGDYSGPTNSPPILPPEEPDPPQTNQIPTNVPPEITVNAVEQTQHLDVTASNWTDSAGAQVTDLYRSVIQSAGDPRGPWTNAYVVTLWQSAYGSTALVEDGDGKALATNYSRRAGNGSVTNFAPLELAHSEPQKFYRARP